MTTSMIVVSHRLQDEAIITRSRLLYLETFYNILFVYGQYSNGLSVVFASLNMDQM